MVKANYPKPETMCLLKEQLQNHDIQVSAPRLAIASYVLDTEDHPTAEEVKAKVEGFFPMVSLATVYNTLNLFVEKKLLKVFKDHSNDSVRYDCNTEPHYHFLDESTGKLSDIPPTEFSLKENKSFSDVYEISSVDVILRGHIRKTKTN